MREIKSMCVCCVLCWCVWGEKEAILFRGLDLETGVHARVRQWTEKDLALHRPFSMRQWGHQKGGGVVFEKETGGCFPPPPRTATASAYSSANRGLVWWDREQVSSDYLRRLEIQMSVSPWSPILAALAQ